MIIERADDGHFTVRSADEQEASSLRKFFASIPRGTKLKYDGGSRDKRQSQYNNPIFASNSDRVILVGTNEVDATHAFNINYLEWCGAESVFDGYQESAEGPKVTLFVFRTCSLCQRACVDATSVISQTCPRCAAVCDHQYKTGLVTGGTTKDGQGLDMGVGAYCKKCGRGDPNQPPVSSRTLAEHHQAVLDAGVIHVIGYKKGGQINAIRLPSPK